MDVFHFLLKHRDSVAKIPDHPRPGVYAIFANTGKCLPGIDLPPCGLVYIGHSRDLQRRNPFKAKQSGFHSPRRSFGAILRTKLNLKTMQRSEGPSATNYKNFRFDNGGEDRFVQWMLSTLYYSIYSFNGHVDELETRLIRENRPSLNLTKWRNSQKQKITQLRKACVEEARLIWQERLAAAPTQSSRY
jgi:hypothetical protein